MNSLYQSAENALKQAGANSIVNIKITSFELRDSFLLVTHFRDVETISFILQERSLDNNFESASCILLNDDKNESDWLIIAQKCAAVHSEIEVSFSVLISISAPEPGYLIIRDGPHRSFCSIEPI